MQADPFSRAGRGHSPQRLSDQPDSTVARGRPREVPAADASWTNWTVHVQVIVLSTRNGQLLFRSTTRAVEPGEAPDDVAWSVADVDPNEPGRLCHSTSWRVDAPATLVLTYAALPGRATAEAIKLRLDPIVAADDSTRPQPDALSLQSIATHAVRHLALLSSEDPTVRRCVPHAPALWRCLVEESRRIATTCEERTAV
jgi:hypothetical protein